MRMAIATFCAAATAAGAAGLAAAPSHPQLSDGPTFDVISIKPHAEDGAVSDVVYQRPDGGFSLTNLPVSHLVVRAYGLTFADDIIGLPAWAKTDLYDVSATSSLTRATTDDRRAMWQAMLADRFGLVAHLEKRSRPAYDLVLARRDGNLGPGLTRVAIDCDAEYEIRRAESERARAAGLPWPPLQDPNQNVQQQCALTFDPPAARRLGWLLAGEATIRALAACLRASVMRPIVDKTGLSGSYRVRLIYDHMPSAVNLYAGTPSDAGPGVFAAVRQQLGLRLRSSRAAQDTLVVDRIERPTEN